RPITSFRSAGAVPMPSPISRLPADPAICRKAQRPWRTGATRNARLAIDPAIFAVGHVATKCLVLTASLSLTSMAGRQKPMPTQPVFSPRTRRDALPLAIAAHTAIDCEPFLDEVEQSFALWFRHAGGIRDCCFQLGF